MAQVDEIIELEGGQYQVAVWFGNAEDPEDGEEASVEPLDSQEQAELVCDLLAIKAALEDERPLASLQLCSQAGPPTFHPTEEAAELIGSTDLEGLVAELQECADVLQDEDWHQGASPGCSAAGMLLLAAATLGHACTAQLLLLLQPSAAGAKGGTDGVSPLHQAAKGGHVAIMAAVLAAMPSAVYLKTDAACSPLLYAAAAAQSEAVRLLLEKAPAVAMDASRSTGGLPLHMAVLATTAGAEEGAVEETLRLLLGAAPHATTAVDFEGETALYWATVARSEAAVRLLLAAAPAAAVVARPSGLLPVHVAAEEGTAAMVRLLLDAAPASITATCGQQRYQPIHCAAVKGNAAAVEVLLAARPKLAAAVDGHQSTPAHYAASYDSKLPALQLLVAAAPETAAAQNSSGQLPAHIAACHNCPAALRCLFDSGSAAQQALATAHDGCTPLHFAAECNSVEAAEVLLQVAPEACLVQDSLDVAPLAVAASCGWDAIVSLLLAAAPQAALATVGDGGPLPIHIAAAQGHAAVVAQLLAACPESAMAVDSESTANETPLDAALLRCQDRDRRAAVARVLLPAMPGSLALDSLLEAGPAGRRLLPEFVAAHLPLSQDIWPLLPRSCPGLSRLLPTALEHSTEQARQLVQHLPAADVARLRCAALCLARAQRRTRVHLPPVLTGLILALAGA